MMTRTLGTVAIGVLALAACGTSEPGSAVPDAPAEADTEQVELVGEGMLIQRSADDDVELCMGPMTMIHPPNCGGPTILGDFSWDDVESQEEQGVRWTGNYVVIGHYDDEADTFTLTQPPTQELPAGVTFPAPPAVDFPQLCEDPFRGGDPDFTDPDLTKQTELTEALESLDGYVGSYVSDGESLFNVVVTGDPEAAHAALREVWDGGLCVIQQDGPSEADLQAAQSALAEHNDELGLETSSGDPLTGVLNVRVSIAYPATVSQVEEIVSEWLTPDQVVIESAFVPLAQG